jgi:hypothetical protein
VFRVECHAEGVLDQSSHSPTAPKVIRVSMRSGSLPEHLGEPRALPGLQARGPALMPHARQRGFPAALPELQPL